MQRENSDYDEPQMRSDVEHAKHFVFVLLRYRWLVAAIVVGVLAVAAVGTLLQTPKYRASALLRVDRGKLNVVEEITQDDRFLGSREFYGTQTRVLTSRALAERTLDNMDAWRHPLLRIDDPGETDVRKRQLDKFLNMLSASQVRNTQLVDVSVSSPEPVFARDLANAHAREYIAFLSETESGFTRNTSSLIREQIEKLQRGIHEKELQLQQYGAQQDVVLEQTDKILAQQLSELHHELTLARGELASVEARYRSLQQSDGASSPDVFNNPTIQQLRQELSRLEKEYAELGTKFEPRWPEMQRRRSALDEVEKRLQIESKNLADKLLVSTRADFRAAQNRVEILKKTLEAQREESRDMSARTSDYSRIRVELESQQAMLEQLTRREGETGLSADLEEGQNINVRVVEEAILPDHPYKPRLLVNLLAAALLGLLLAPAVAFLLNYWDSAIHNAEDLKRYARVPCLALIPHFSRERTLPARGTTPQLEAGRNRGSELVRAGAVPAEKRKPGYAGKAELLERFKFLRNSVVLSTPNNPPKVVLVTSGSEREGKSFVASNFAASFAQLDKKVLLIDADLRRPTVHNFFGIRNKVGLTNVIVGQSELTDGCVQQTNVPNLYVLLAGPSSPSPAELLGSDKMASVLKECEKHFDVIVVDSAPLFPVVDSHALAARADSALLVVRSGSTKGPAVRNAIDLLEQAHGNLAGIVLNDIDLMDFAQSYYYNHHSYSYAPNGYQGSAKA